jgi:hypothetical protein
MGIDDGATVEAGGEPPHDTVMTATATASVMRETIGLGRYNDIGYSWLKTAGVMASACVSTPGVLRNIPAVATQKVNHELRRFSRFRWEAGYQLLPIEGGN